ncbi:MAG: DUF3786 domain-containing protein [Thermodesulfobacteriota bacterium]
MARKDDFINAFKLAAQELQLKNPMEVGRLSGAGFDKDRGWYQLDFINRPVIVNVPEVTVKYLDSSDEIPLTEQVLVLHYLNEAKGSPLTDDLITYREVPAGEFYYPAFRKRAEAPFLSVFGGRPDLLPRLAPLLGGESLPGHGDAAARFQPLPRVPVTIVVWGGDEEFEPAGKILFDRSIHHYLSTEDVAWLSGMIVYRLMRLASIAEGE